MSTEEKASEKLIKELKNKGVQYFDTPLVASGKYIYI
jgi:hypothetical protein